MNCIEGDELIQLDLPAVMHLTPSYATEEHVYEALEHCGMYKSEIFAEFDRRTVNVTNMPTQAVADEMRNILYDRYKSELLKVTAHRVPVSW